MTTQATAIASHRNNHVETMLCHSYPELNKRCCTQHNSSWHPKTGFATFTVWILLLLPDFASGWQGCLSLKSFAGSCSSSTALQSSIFFDDDDDLGWDEENDVENEFDVEYQGNALGDISSPGIVQVEKKESNVENKSTDLLDDTDDFYYEKLFEEQIHENSEEQIHETAQSDVADPENNHDERSLEEEAEQEYQLRQTAITDWRLHLQEFEQESLRFRQSNRIQKKRQRLQERASFLALRALRPQKIVLNDDTKKYYCETLPQPTLSLSSTRNYLRREDLLQDTESVNLEQKLHGERYKNALGVYTRLLTSLDQMQMQSQMAAKDYIYEQVEREVESLFYKEEKKETEKHIASSMVGREESFDDLVKNNRRHQARMTTIISMSLHKDSNGMSKLHHNEEREMPMDHRMTKQLGFNAEFDSIPTHDLQTVLRIRGNIKRRGRLPKSRRKILSQLQQSFLTPLF